MANFKNFKLRVYNGQVVVSSRTVAKCCGLNRHGNLLESCDQRREKVGSVGLFYELKSEDNPRERYYLITKEGLSLLLNYNDSKILKWKTECMRRMTEKEFELWSAELTVNNIQLTPESLKENLETIFECPEDIEEGFEKLVERINGHHFSTNIGAEISKRIECFNVLRDFIAYISESDISNTDFINRNKDRDIQLLELTVSYTNRLLELTKKGLCDIENEDI